MPVEYFNSLTQEQKSNISAIIIRLRCKGISNPFSQAAILSVCSKESGFIPTPEKPYNKTANSQIRKIFGIYLAKYDEAALTKLKADTKAFFEAVYGVNSGRKKDSKGTVYGNIEPGDGAKYIGGGLNQLTFRANYRATGLDIGVDLEKCPERINELPVAIDALISYFARKFKSAPAERLKHYNTDGLNGFKDLMEATKAVYHANAGWGKDYAKLENANGGSVNKGRTRALDRASGFLKIVNAQK